MSTAGRDATSSAKISVMTLGQLATSLGAVVSPGDNIVSAADLALTGVAGIEIAGPGQVTFLANPKYAALVRTTQAAAVIVDPAFPATTVTTLRIVNPYLAWSRAISLFHPPPVFPPGIHPTAVIAPTATLGRRPHIGAYVVIGDHCILGDDAVLLPHTVLYSGVIAGHRLFAHSHAVVREGCRLGDDVVLQNGAVIGADGFGFARDDAGHWTKIQQAGPAVLEDRVEVQANACIDRASVGETRIKAGAKVDNLVQVGHGSVVGQDTLLCAQVGLAGSSTIGRNVILAGQVGVAGHLTVGDGVVATAQTGIPSDVAPGAVVSGYPAMDNRSWLRMVAALNRVPDLIRQVRTLTRKSGEE